MSTTAATDTDMHVLKRNGEREIVAFDKILTRLKTLGAQSKITGVNYTTLVIKIIDQLYDGIPTTKIDELTAQQCAMMAVQHPDYGTLASYIIISNAHKNIPGRFYDSMRVLYEYRDANNKHIPIISKQVWDFLHCAVEVPGVTPGEGPVSIVIDALEMMIDHSRDYLIDYFGYKTLERSYLMRCHGAVVERPQHMWMRVAIGIHSQRKDTRSVYETLVYIQNTYNAMSQKYMTHATPTLFNAGTPRPQLSSCYLVAMENDSIDGIFDTLKDCAKISKHAGGIGLHIHNIRSSGSHIRGTNGASNGIVPMLRVFNNTARYIDQGGRRNGSFAIYLEPWHPDIEDFLEMKKNHGDEEMKGRDLFYALWVPDLFMERVRGGGGGGGGAGGTDMWSYFCPDECPGLADVYGDDFRVLYEKYESEGRARKQVKARELWLKILDSQMETGTPYILFKDAVNKKSNQKNVGTIKSSNLCTEIMEYSDENETAVCNLASIALSRFVFAVASGSGFAVASGSDAISSVASDHSIAGGDSVVSGSSVVSRTESRATSEGAVGGRIPPLLDFAELERITALIVDNLNQIIDINYYPTTKTRTSNLRHRPIGIGVQGLADVFMMMNIPFHSEEARVLNREIFETIYYAAVNASMTLAARHGAYETFPGSPASQGILQFDMWGVDPTADSYPEPKYRTYKYDWAALKSKVQKYGLRNSLLLAPMPTASTSQILGNNECFEPITSNIYTRRTLAGEFIMVNRYLISDLITLGMWNERVKTNIIANQGSVQYIDGLPDALKLKYKTVWEMPMRHIIDMAADRGAFICQSQSMNLWVEEPNYNILTSMLFYAWNKGLKTGVYYLRRKAKHQAQQFTVEPDNGGAGVGVAEEDDICEFCSS